MSSAPTLEDVAERAGVSTATVSRCLNAPEKVIEPTRERVMEAVNALGYAPNFSARALAARRTHTIGAVIPTMENAIFAQGLQAFQDSLRQAGYMLFVASSSYDPEVEIEQIRALVARGVDGLLLIGHDRDPGVYQFLETRGVPFLVTWAYRADMPSIGFDNRVAMRTLVERALHLGHRRIGAILAHRQGNDRARERAEGIFEAAEAFGINKAEIPIVETEYGIAEGARAFDRLYDREKPPTLVLCGNDVLAAGALRRAEERGLSVPRDLSLTGFDDIEFASVLTPRLTTVHVPHRKMGAGAAKALIAMSEGETAGLSQCLATEIREGETLAAPPIRDGESRP